MMIDTARLLIFKRSLFIKHTQVELIDNITNYHVHPNFLNV